VQALGHALAALAAELPVEQSVQMLVDAMKIPWMAGAPSEPLLAALQVSLNGEAEPQLGLWETVAQIEQKFCKTIDLTSPPSGRNAPPQ
jgi:hypothetical protein